MRPESATSREQSWRHQLCQPLQNLQLLPAALGDKAQFTRKRAAAEPTDDDMATAMRAAVKKARGAAAPKPPPKAMPKTPPKAAPKSAPAGKPQSKLAAMPKKGGGCKRAGEQLDLHLERLGVGSGTAQAPRSRSAAFPMVLRAGRVTLPGAQLMTFAAAYSQERSEQWTDVWPAVKRTVWHGDNVLIHCIKGRHRGALLSVLCRALLAGESIEAANRHIEDHRETELHKVIKDQGMKK